MSPYWLLLLPMAALSGRLSAGHGFSRLRRLIRKKRRGLSADYLKGLNYLLNQEEDKAVDLFIRMLPVDLHTVDTHLSLGNLFRRRGEVYRAIRIHQNVMAQSALTSESRTQALFDLARDYLSAGLLDRAERLFLELLENRQKISESLVCLLDIYEQQRDWPKAIQIAKQLPHQALTQMALAHYHCELANLAMGQKDWEDAETLAKRAMGIEKHLARAYFILSEISEERGDFESALKYLQQANEQNMDYILESLPALSRIYQALHDAAGCTLYFRDLLKRKPELRILQALVEALKIGQQESEVLPVVREFVAAHPSVAALDYYLCLPALSEDVQVDPLFKTAIAKLSHPKHRYQCQNCGFASKYLYWHCPGCKRWGSSILQRT